MTTLILELPDEQMQVLEHVAQQHGTDVSAFIVEMIGDVTAQRTFIERSNLDLKQDSIYNIKSHNTRTATDLSQNADDYLYGIVNS